jgi:hypothetical protein
MWTEQKANAMPTLLAAALYRASTQAYLMWQTTQADRYILL